MSYKQISARALWTLLILIGSTLTLRAQAPAGTFEELRTGLRLKEQESIEITEENGSMYKARIAQLSERTLVITVDGVRRELGESQVREIRHRRPDKWWNGMLIGLGAGIASASVGVVSVCGSNDSECTAIASLVFLPTFAGIGMGAGAAIDFAIKKHETVFARPGFGTNRNIQVSPIMGRNTKGLSVAFRF